MSRQLVANKRKVQPAVSSSEQDTSGRVHAVFERVIRDGLRRGAVQGASDEQIDQMAANQGVERVPDAAREVLRLIGLRPGLWWAGTAFGVLAMDADAKQRAIWMVDRVENNIRDPDGLLVLSAHQGYVYHVIDGADLHQDDPPVWSVVEDKPATPTWESVTTWFDGTAPRLARQRQILELMIEMNNVLPAWADDIELT